MVLGFWGLGLDNNVLAEDGGLLQAGLMFLPAKIKKDQPAVKIGSNW